MMKNYMTLEFVGKAQMDDAIVLHEPPLCLCH